MNEEIDSKDQGSNLSVRLKAIEDQFKGKLNAEEVAKMQVLTTNDVFSVLETKEALSVKDMMHEIQLESGDYLYKAGDESKYV